MYQKILVPLDGSDPSNCGLMEAIKLAKNQSASIRLIHVSDEHPSDPNYCLGSYASNFAESFREAGEKVLNDGAALVRQFGLEPQAVPVEALDGTLSTSIARHAKAWGADLIVMGTHGRRGLKRLAMGSDADAVVRETRIPVLLIHDGSQNTPEAQKAEAETSAVAQQVYA